MGKGFIGWRQLAIVVAATDVPFGPAAISTFTLDLGGTVDKVERT